MRSLKCSRRPRTRQPQEYGNGYDHLDGEWATYYRIASRFAHKSKADERGDLLHDVILTLADVARSQPDKVMSEATMSRIASHETGCLVVAVAKPKGSDAARIGCMPSAQRP
ncbi:MAG: hypothetical protein NTU41_06170 [Chloroflexi bacterium]|nr:hypothetical protein [Chloroflexota bacterium]